MASISTILLMFNAFYGDGARFFLSVIAYIYLFIRCKSIRRSILLPILIIFLVITNPILYQYIFSKIVYRRLFWMVPNTLLIATAIVHFFKSCSKSWMKILVVVIAYLCITNTGANVFENNVFTNRQNWEKIGEWTISVCDMMLEVDPNPKAVVPMIIFAEVRQYAPEINMMYGRNAQSYITYIDQNALSVYYHMEDPAPDYGFVLSKAVEMQYDFIVAYEAKPIEQAILEQFGYYEVGRTYGMVVYHNPNIAN